MTDTCNSCLREFTQTPKLACERKSAHAFAIVHDEPDPDALTSADCIDHRGDGCEGKVEYRHPLSGTGQPFARCELAWTKRLDIEDGIRQRYPDSSTPPADFDPSYAGESWDED